jgi:hypothetical protein
MNWVVGQRVRREDEPAQVGAVTEVNREIKVRWDNGTISFYDLNGYVPLVPLRPSETPGTSA